jgi:hypothetical protein
MKREREFTVAEAVAWVIVTVVQGAAMFAGVWAVIIAWLIVFA